MTEYEYLMEKKASIEKQALSPNLLRRAVAALDRQLPSRFTNWTNGRTKRWPARLDAARDIIHEGGTARAYIENGLGQPLAAHNNPRRVALASSKYERNPSLRNLEKDDIAMTEEFRALYPSSQLRQYSASQLAKALLGRLLPQ